MRPSSVILLALALAAGIFVRFHSLGALEMSADEGASWAAAAAPTLRQVVQLQQHLNPGKLAVHEVALRVWMRIFGDSLPSIRGLSAACGSISILLVFMVTRETLAAAPIGETGGDWTGAMSALLSAVNFEMIAESREVRMYMVMVTMLLAQVWFFLRVKRAQGTGNYIGMAIFSVLAVGAHFMAALVIVAECLWLAPQLYRTWKIPAGWRDDPNWKVIGVLGLTAIVTLPLFRTALGIGYGFARAGNLGWISSPALSAPFETFRYDVRGSSAFALCAVAALWGIARLSCLAPRTLAFLLLWMFFPPFALLLFSYVVLPIFVDRYALSSLVPFLILAAFGIYAIPSRWAASLALLALTAACATPTLPMIRGERPPWMVEWSEAAGVTAADLKPNEYAVVFPDWMINAVRYYLRNDPETPVIPAIMERLARAQSQPAIVVLNNKAALDDPQGGKFLLWAAPDVIASFQGVSVRRVNPERWARIRDLSTR